ncbi:MAG: TetR/AcrR family transcriptional regulator [Corynebacterium sp.]|uniref:TetR/AcrR family transcriptional regulator n=1 Tax=Corynebacterium sp. TaxID=1720 RepID=UPI0026DC55CE|nr:TetR/AcrR family transcriptional regulator [Corynebacterium sp.]MDO4761670.1 TetR/AcrR family transcriptional regulator [Corynebacterium sp.]
MMAQRRGRKTGPKPKFSRQDVIDAAFRVGVDDFTLAEVANELSVAPSAVYRLFDSRDALVHSCMKQAAEEVAQPIEEGTSWKDALMLWATRCWDLCEKYPGLALTILRHPSAIVYLEEYFNYFVPFLVKAGLKEDDAMLALDFISDTVLTTHVSVTAMKTANAQGQSELDFLFAHTSENAVIRPDESWAQRGFLDRKLSLIIEGLAIHSPITETSSTTL